MRNRDLLSFLISFILLRMGNKEDIWRSPNGIAFVSEDLIETVKSFPTIREVVHCDSAFYVSPFDFYGVCPKCALKIKIRSFSNLPEIEDLFDAVFEWLLKPGAKEIFSNRQKEILEDSEESR